jgi:hypothetical protein
MIALDNLLMVILLVNPLRLDEPLNRKQFQS